MKLWQKMAIAGLVLGISSSFMPKAFTATLGETTVNQGAIAQMSVASDSRLTKEALLNAEYQVPDYGKFRLVNGQYVYKTGASQKTSIKLETYTAIVDLDKDGAKDAVVVLNVSPGAPNNYKFLAIVMNQQGTPVNIDTLYLDDRIKVKKIALLKSGEIAVTILNREQTGTKIVKYKLQGGRIVRV
ncbi:hypothetical protein V2H45_10520 [Tumidithrix elongata RA019]|uniref:Uncharacterized protein n=1 Tax=Tumidithrix elongata BACA0141 TaxID=2716417 RepID=A0AAW9Q1R8_9CYAN|nr:hypothetical protein [Tumidithrix elongata RA019]